MPEQLERYKNIAQELKDLKQWVGFCLIENRDTGKFDKVPINPTQLCGAKSNDSTSWSDYETAVNSIGKAATFYVTRKDSDGKTVNVKSTNTISGIGIMFANNLCGIDIDGCIQVVNGTSTVSALALSIMETMKSYTEVSPSGTGIHILFLGSIDDDPKYYKKNASNGVEIYQQGRFFTVTGRTTKNKYPLRDCTTEVRAIQEKYMLKPQKDKPPQLYTQQKIQPISLSTNEILQKAFNSKNGDDFKRLWHGDIYAYDNDDSRADLALCNHLAFWTSCNAALMDEIFRQSGLMRDKWDRPQSGTTYGAITIEKAINGCKEVYTGHDNKPSTKQDFNNIKIPQPDEWEQPIPFDSVEVPPFPVDCLPLSLKNYVLAVSEATQTPIDMAAVASLATMAVCVQGKFKIQGKPDWIEPLNLYSAIVANPGERKSAVLHDLTKYIYEYEYLANEKLQPEVERNKAEKKMLLKEFDKLVDSIANKKASKEELLQKQDELTNFKEIKSLRLLADDASAEALTTLLATNDGKISVISSEGGIFEILGGRYSQSVNIDTFLKAHCGDPIRVDRKGRESEYIKEPCMTVLLSIQPQVLDGLVSNDVFRGRGLTARFLYCIPTSRIGERVFETDSIALECKMSYRELCFDLLDLKPNKVVDILKLSDEAYTMTAAFAKELEPRLIEDLADMTDFAGKLHGAVLRIAGILHLVKQLVFSSTTPVSADTMREAIQIGYYFLEHARAAYQLMGANEGLKEARYILKRLEKQKFEKLTKNELLRLCKKFKSTDEMIEPLKLLIERNYLKEQEQIYSGFGRPPEPIYFMNPLTYKLIEQGV